MQYMGGKSRCAKAIVDAIESDGGSGTWWDAFCGGQSVSAALASRFGPGRSTDKNAALIALYKAVQAGWQPPEVLSFEEWEVWKEASPDDPRFAFAMQAVTFSGVWNGGYAHDKDRSRAGASRRALLRDAAALADSCIESVDFLEETPARGTCDILYLDPPYVGVTGYPHMGRFDHKRFHERLREWTALGIRVYVSEYTKPEVPCVEIWQKRIRPSLRTKSGADKYERLFRIR